MLTSAETNGTKQFLRFFCDATTAHELAQNVSPPLNSLYSSKAFHGIGIETCCTFSSTSGIEQYKPYCNFVGEPPQLDKKNVKNVKSGTGQTNAFGSAAYSFPIENLWFHFSLLIVNAEVPLLFSLADMDQLGLAYQNTNALIIHRKYGSEVAVIQTFGHPLLI